MAESPKWSVTLEIRYGRFYLRKTSDRMARDKELSAAEAAEIAPMFGPQVQERIHDQVRVNAIKAREHAQKSSGWIAEAVKRAHEATTVFQQAAEDAAALGVKFEEGPDEILTEEED